MKLHLEERNRLIRSKYDEALPRLGSAKAVYQFLWDDFKLRPNSLHQIIHHPEWYDKKLAVANAAKMRCRYKVVLLLRMVLQLWWLLCDTIVYGASQVA